jgi:hypothetical protein
MYIHMQSFPSPFAATPQATSSRCPQRMCQAAVVGRGGSIASLEQVYKFGDIQTRWALPLPALRPTALPQIPSRVQLVWKKKHICWCGCVSSQGYPKPRTNLIQIFPLFRRHRLALARTIQFNEDQNRRQGRKQTKTRPVKCTHRAHQDKRHIRAFSMAAHPYAAIDPFTINLGCICLFIEIAHRKTTFQPDFAMTPRSKDLLYSKPFVSSRENLASD